MNKLKVFISFILLFIYSAGFTHILIPHEHNIHTDIHETHQHHEHEASLEDHMHHGNHHHHDLFDLIVHFLVEVDHSSPLDDVKNYFQAESNKITFKTQFNNFAAVLWSFAPLSVEIIENINYTNSTVCYLSPLVVNSPHRGPPSLTV